ncbi:unnamed protein product [Ilex paraguariensis]|uniref:Uncharacterized protein n=1 Tax=Ilex paraguariensis TaxID=185542 RepID=A0ABC8U5Z8_9AQUA
MGCGISTFHLVDDGVIHGCGPLGKGRRNDRAKVDGNPSTKLLLNVGGDDDDDSTVDSSGNRKSVSSIKVDDSDFNGGHNTISSHTKKVIYVRELAFHEQRVKPSHQNKETVKQPVVDFDVKIKKLDGDQERERDVEAVEGEEEGERISDFNGSLLIGSPSFREYCYNDSDSDDSVNNGGNKDGEKTEANTPPGDKIASSSEICYLEGSRTRSDKKGRRGRRFRKVFPMHRTSAVKNLLNVTTCYNPNASSCRGAQKLPEKAF